MILIATFGGFELNAGGDILVLLFCIRDRR
jgi:hypothetical protein